MKVTGIIAEYNPFHNGHALQIRAAREEAGADYVVVLLSPCFVQRGETAIADQHTRAEMALLSGADLILELPVRYALGSAPVFAGGGVRILDAAGCIDTLCFGCETMDTGTMEAAADILVRDTEPYRTLLRRHLSSGLSFPLARQEALLACLEGHSRENVLEILTQPNNILGLEYLCAIRRTGSRMTPFPVHRRGDGYHSQTVNDPSSPSAAALRVLIRRKETDPECLEDYIPSASLGVLLNAIKQQGLPSDDLLSAMLGYCLLQDKDFTCYEDCSPALANRILHTRFSYESFSQYAGLLHTKECTHSRIRRVLLHILLNIQKDSEEPLPPYARILGFKRDAAPLLHQIRNKGDLTLIAKCADARNILTEEQYASFCLDMTSSMLYRRLLRRHSTYKTENEITRSPLCL